MKPKHCYLSLGSNLGNRKAFIRQAYELIREFAALDKVSGFYENEALGFKSDSLFLNTVIAIKTNYAPNELLLQIHKIEEKLGRLRYKDPIYRSRTIDIDIIDYNGEVTDEKDLVIPHPRIYERGFVLYPLQEICPNWKDPLSEKSIEDLIESLPGDKETITLV